MTDTNQLSDATICEHCGEERAHHRCQQESRTRRIRELNDAFRKAPDLIGVRIALGQLVITRGVAALGTTFIDSAVETVRNFANFSEDNDPRSEHDFGSFEIDGVKLFWKIDCYDNELEHASPDPTRPDMTRRVLTIMLAEEY